MPQRSRKLITSTQENSVVSPENRHGSQCGPSRHALTHSTPDAHAKSRAKVGPKVISQAWNRTPDLPRPSLTDIFDCRPTSPPVMYAHELKYILNTYGPYHLGFPICEKGLNLKMVAQRSSYKQKCG